MHHFIYASMQHFIYASMHHFIYAFMHQMQRWERKKFNKTLRKNPLIQKSYDLRITFLKLIYQNQNNT